MMMTSKMALGPPNAARTTYSMRAVFVDAIGLDAGL
jgi:hypothetical protein